MRALTTALPGLLLLTALAGCSEPARDTTTAAPPTTGPAAAAPSAGGAASAAPASPKSGGKAKCAVKDVAVTITAQPGDDPKVQRGLVAVTNTAKQACTLRGWLTITLVNAADEAVDVPTETVPEPGPEVDVDLKPGTTGFAGIKWTTCDKSETSCGAGNTIRFNLTKSTTGPAAKLDGFPAATKSDITMKSLQIGSLQPATQGVVAW
ncbi:DUF4232 domain-containing protein [Actinoplanes philippinensis]|uniref:DUF4232 domain-containing protein n=1 Tax=Actinoplanes philippinensis TaxID=35752 RepID=UPI003403BC88